MTRRQRMHVRSFVLRAIVVLIAAGILVGIGLGIGNILRNYIFKKDTGTPALQEESAEFIVSESTPEPIPEITPEPTPEPYADKPALDVTDWNLRLVNFWNPLESDFAPALSDIEEEERFDSRASMHLLKLIEDARAAGYMVYVCSCFRDYETQSIIYWNHVEDYEAEGMTREEAEAATRLAVNYPGCSEHQLGLAADLLEYNGQDMEPYIGGSGLMLWLEEHCADYGFIVRYPEGKTDITGVEYEPWHLRYVGTCARYIMTHDLCLEEFLALYE